MNTLYSPKLHTGELAFYRLDERLSKGGEKVSFGPNHFIIYFPQRFFVRVTPKIRYEVHEDGYWVRFSKIDIDGGLLYKLKEPLPPHITSCNHLHRWNYVQLASSVDNGEVVRSPVDKLESELSPEELRIMQRFREFILIE